ncbi:UDP-glucose 4-epimerase GalE [Deinococcus aestuarii]|uniref:UDP-glucose 4-epimerase GalE n=1 Tax=Deinococcus aestuarii TaxID=2774531 RepID=UPI001C0B065A|nr:UDP-glucose 4-epimerase GalE [Deinococcus aestuarii]
MKVLVTGGAGYIGSTVCSALEEHGHTPVILDSLVTGRREFTRGRAFYRGDIADRPLLERLLDEHPETCCTIHCAALIVVPESVAEPYRYYRENVAKSLDLFQNLVELGQTRVVFSSSASIYDASPDFRVTEDSPLRPGSPYARTKYMMEMVLEDLCHATELRGIALRYFNPIGADPGLRSGSHVEAPSHVLGRIVEAARGRLPVFEVTGTDWPTRDGSGLRDYIHVWDLALAHVRAVEQFDAVLERARLRDLNDRYLAVNLGTGQGVTVRELVAAFERVSRQPLPLRAAPPRPGDVGGAYAGVERAWELLGWRPQSSVDEGIRTALAWDERKILG